MEKLQANTAGLHQPSHDYNRSALGTFGSRDVKIEGASVHLRSSKPNSFKSLMSRVADLLPGNNGRVRSFNRNQKELSRELGQLLGRVYTEGKKGPVDRLASDLSKVLDRSDKLASKLAGYDHEAMIDARLGVHLDKLSNEALEMLVSAFRKQSVDPQGHAATAERIANDYESIGLPGIGQELQQGLAVQTGKAAALLDQIRDAVNERYAERISLSHGFSSGEAKALVAAGAPRKELNAWRATGIRNPQLTSFLNAGVKPSPARQIVNGGKTATDFTQLMGAGLGLSADAAVSCLKGGCDLAEIQKLVQSGLSQQEAIEYASSGCSLVQKNILEQQGLTKGEILAIRSSGWDNQEATDLEVFRFQDVDPQDVSIANGGGVNDVFKVTVGRENGPETMYFARAATTVPGNASGIFFNLNNNLMQADPPRLAERNVATFKANNLLGFQITPETGFASLQSPDGEIMVGTAMAQAPGKAVQDVVLVPTGGWRPALPYEQSTLQNTYGGDLKKFNDYHERSGIIGRINPQTNALEIDQLELQPHDIPVNNPSLRQQAIQLQYLDALAGQGDRSQGNYFVQKNSDGTVTLTGIDNDLAWGNFPSSRAEMDDAASGISGQLKFLGLPPVADQDIIDRFTKMTPDDLEDELGHLLTGPQLDAAKGRLKAIQEHLAQLPRTNIVSDWGPGADAIFNTELNEGNCYLMRDAQFFKPAA